MARIGRRWVAPTTRLYVAHYKAVNDNPTSQLIIRQTVRNSLGNLTLLTQSLNSSVSRGPFSGKRPAITQQSRLSLNAYFQRFSDDDVWNEETIIKRGEELADLAIRVWPHP